MCRNNGYRLLLIKTGCIVQYKYIYITTPYAFKDMTTNES